MNRLRDGALTSVIGQVRAPSTLGSFLRAFDSGNVRQLQARAWTPTQCGTFLDSTAGDRLDAAYHLAAY